VHADEALRRGPEAVDDRDASAQDHEEARRGVAGTEEDLAGHKRAPLAGSLEHRQDVLAEPRERRIAVERVLRHGVREPTPASAFTPEQVAIETGDSAVLEALHQPRASFAGHAAETPWSSLQLAYFVGTAMWTYLTQPFTFTLPGFQTAELEPWDEAGQHWRRLRVTWPSYLARHDYDGHGHVVSQGSRCHSKVSSLTDGDVAGLCLTGYSRQTTPTGTPTTRRAAWGGGDL
jgi:hypothetical protein